MALFLVAFAFVPIETVSLAVKRALADVPDPAPLPKATLFSPLTNCPA